ncbi:hypothetical protein PMIT1327_00378 [Prochlorococcus marinus str. MIT 1327]|nr:hypothetical protein PMIT1327_00378 [Prochlorococcus marinus str. MIT 1327]
MNTVSAKQQQAQILKRVKYLTNHAVIMKPTFCFLNILNEASLRKNCPII